MNNKKCYTEEELFDYAIQQEEGNPSLKIKQHLIECSACQKLFEQTKSFNEDLLELKNLNEIPLTKIEKYTIESQLGQGGMGIVYKAIDPDLERNVAIKLLNKEINNDENYKERFLKEARTVAKFSHQNIVQIFTTGIQDNKLFMVMEYIKGLDLTGFYQRTPYQLNTYLDIFHQSLLGLEYAHKKGFIHRDLKPSNIMLTNEGQVKILDFGLVSTQDESQYLTQPGTLLGTVAYMAPEIAKGYEASFQSDIYSLGIVFYELLTQQLPFIGNTPLKTLEKIKSDHLIEPIMVNKNIPNYLNDIILKMCSKNCTDRYLSVSEIIKDLKHEVVEQKLSSDKFQKQDPLTSTLNVPQDIRYSQVENIIQIAEDIKKEKENIIPKSTIKSIGSELDISSEILEEAIKRNLIKKKYKPSHNRFLRISLYLIIIFFSLIVIFSLFFFDSRASSPSLSNTHKQKQEKLSVNVVKNHQGEVTFNGYFYVKGQNSKLVWNWGDGTKGPQYFPAKHRYVKSGNYKITVEAISTDSKIKKVIDINVNITAPLYHSLNFELGEAEFYLGDSVTIQSIKGNRSLFEVGGNYQVKGHYTINSSEKLRLYLYSTNGDIKTNEKYYQTHPGQHEFIFNFTILKSGFLHLTFYDQEGKAKGGIYFGQGANVLKNKSWKYKDNY